MPAKQLAFYVATVSRARNRMKGILLTSLLVLSAVVAAKSDKTRNEAFVAGNIDEGRIAQQVRHQLLMLP